MSFALHPDIRFALREMRRHPSASFIPVLALALGIGAATTVFRVVNGVLLKPLPRSRHEVPGT